MGNKTRAPRTGGNLEDLAKGTTVTSTIDLDAARALASYKGDDAVRTANYSTDFPCVRDEVSQREWQARVDLAACYRLVDLTG